LLYLFLVFHFVSFRFVSNGISVSQGGQLAVPWQHGPGSPIADRVIYHRDEEKNKQTKCLSNALHSPRNVID